MSTPNEFTIIDGVPKPLLARALRTVALEQLEEKRRAYTAAAKELARTIEAPGGFPSKYPTSDQLGCAEFRLEECRNDYMDALELAERLAVQAAELDGAEPRNGDADAERES